jgi:hypothetical protein
MALWFFGADSIVKSVSAVGVNAHYTVCLHQDTLRLARVYNFLLRQC